MNTDNRQPFLDAALKTGLRLCRDAIWANGKCNWIGPAMEWVDNQWKVIHRMGGAEIYGGTSGTGLFLSYLYRFSGEEPLKKTAIAAIRHSLSKADKWSETGGRFGFYSGLCGIAYAAIKTGQNTGQPGLTRKGQALLRKLTKEPPRKETLDIVSGSAGYILALAALHGEKPSAAYLSSIRRHADMLLAEGRPSERGISWAQAGIQQRGNLTGFSHGAAGMATALMEAWRITGEDKYRATAESAIQYEQSWFNAQVGNWPDLRLDMSRPQQPEQGPSYPSQWCHGAAGILLSRAHAWQATGNEAYRQQAEAAIRSCLHTLQDPQQYGLANYCLCHGQAGNAAILLLAAKMLGRPDLQQAAEQKGMEGINWFHKNDIPWPGGIPGHPEEAPGMMMGCAGTGYFYLRLFNPDEAPPILLLSGAQAGAQNIRLPKAKAEAVS